MARQIRTYELRAYQASKGPGYTSVTMSLWGDDRLVAFETSSFDELRSEMERFGGIKAHALGVKAAAGSFRDEQHGCQVSADVPRGQRQPPGFAKAITPVFVAAKDQALVIAEAKAAAAAKRAR